MHDSGVRAALAELQCSFSERGGGLEHPLEVMTGLASGAAILLSLSRQLGAMLLLAGAAVGLVRIGVDLFGGDRNRMGLGNRRAQRVTRTATTTLLFTDVVESTLLLSRFGDEAVDEIRAAHFALLHNATATNNGVVVKSLGDGFMVAFTSTVEAINCAVAMQQAVDRENSRHDQLAVGLRVGISVGEVTLEGNDYFGTPVVEAARLCATGNAGEILVSDVLRLIAQRRSRHRFVSRGTRNLKGLASSLPLYEVSWREPAGLGEPDVVAG